MQSKVGVLQFEFVSILVCALGCLTDSQRVQVFSSLTALIYHFSSRDLSQPLGRCVQLRLRWKHHHLPCACLYWHRYWLELSFPPLMGHRLAGSLVFAGDGGAR